jgi:hypothetical protein
MSPDFAGLGLCGIANPALFGAPVPDSRAPLIRSPDAISAQARFVAPLTSPVPPGKIPKRQVGTLTGLEARAFYRHFGTFNSLEAR